MGAPSPCSNSRFSLGFSFKRIMRLTLGEKNRINLGMNLGLRSCHSQNPNLTTTQPKVGFDMIIAHHATPLQPTGSVRLGNKIRVICRIYTPERLFSQCITSVHLHYTCAV